MKRKSIATATEATVLIESGRRCAFCFGLHGDLAIKAGQIAHVNHDPSNAALENLAYLCLMHHDEYDGSTRQRKGLTQAELLRYRAALVAAIARKDHVVTPDVPPEGLMPADTHSGRNLRAATSPEARVPEDGTNTLPISVSAPGGVLSFGQSGGITAREVIINANEPPRITASHQVQRATGDPTAPWSTAFTITASALVSTGDVRLKCTGAVLRAGIERINPASLVTGSNGPDPSDPTVVVYQLGPELLAPGRGISLAVFSTTPVFVVAGSIGLHQIDF